MSAAFAQQQETAQEEVPAIPTQKVGSWLPTHSGVGGIAISPDGGKLYVAYGGNKDGAPIEEYSLKTGALLRTFRYEEKYGHADAVLSKDGRYLYTNNYYFTHISRIDLSSRPQEAQIAIGGVSYAVWAGDLAAAPNGKLLLVSVGRDGRNYDMENDQISIVDISGDEFSLVGEVKLPDEPTGRKIGFSPDSRFAYVIAYPRQSKAARLYEISLEKPFRVLRSVEFPDGKLEGVAAGENKVFVSDSFGKKIRVVDRKEFKLQSDIQLEGSVPGTLLMAPKLDILYALTPVNRALWAIDVKTGKALAQVKGLRRNASDLEITPDGASLMVSHGGEEGGIAVIKLPIETAPAEVKAAGTQSIVFASDRDGSYQLYSMSEDGGNLRRLTRSNATEKSPRWSPDGSKIAFISDRDGPPRIGIINADGTGLQILKNTDPVLGDVNGGVPLDWSPDGSKLVFINVKRTAIRTVGADGAGLKTIIEGTFGKGYSCYNSVSWRWDSKAILFNAQHPDTGYYQDVFSINPETGKVAQITDEWGNYSHSGAPALSPDRVKIAVVKHPVEGAAPRNIFVINPAGKEFVNLTKGDDMAAAPRWAPDGKKIVFCSGTNSLKHIWLMNADGSGQEQLTSGDGDDIEPDIVQMQPGAMPQIIPTPDQGSAALPVARNDYPVKIDLMPHIPTAIYSLFTKDKKDGGLGGCVMNVRLENRSTETAVFSISYLLQRGNVGKREIEVPPSSVPAEVCLNPILSAEDIRGINTTEDQVMTVEVYRKMPETGKLKPLIDDYSRQIKLYPYDQFFPEITDARGQALNLLDSIVSWVNPGDRNLDLMFSKAAHIGDQMNPKITLIGPQSPKAFSGPTDTRSLEDRDKDYLAQIKLVYDVLKTDYQLIYFDSSTGEEFLGTQRITYPAATLKERKGGNCIELAVLFASLLEKMRLNPVIVLLFKEKHALVGWRVEAPNGEKYHLLDTNYFGQDFARVLSNGDSRLGDLGLTSPIGFRDGFLQRNSQRGKPISRVIDIEMLRQKYPPSQYVTD